MKHIKWYYSLKAWVRPLGRLRVLSKGQNSRFSEYGHVAYQIKENDAYINMVANIKSIPVLRD